VHGTTEAAAAAMLKAAQAKGPVRQPVTYRLKYADNYPTPAPARPRRDPAPQYGTEQMGYNSVNAIYPQEEQIPVPGMDSTAPTRGSTTRS
jgi:hypothetical protein